MRGSLLISILLQMEQEEKVEAVRCSLVKSFSSIYTFVEDDDKYTQVSLCGGKNHRRFKTITVLHWCVNIENLIVPASVDRYFCTLIPVYGVIPKAKFIFGC